MYTFEPHVSVLLLPSLEHRRARNRTLVFTLKCLLLSVSHIMYNRSVNYKGIQRKELTFWHQARNLNIH